MRPVAVTSIISITTRCYRRRAATQMVSHSTSARRFGGWYRQFATNPAAITHSCRPEQKQRVLEQYFSTSRPQIRYKLEQRYPRRFDRIGKIPREVGREYVHGNGDRKKIYTARVSTFEQRIGVLLIDGKEMSCY